MSQACVCRNVSSLCVPIAGNEIHSKYRQTDSDKQRQADRPTDQQTNKQTDRRTNGRTGPDSDQTRPGQTRQDQQNQTNNGQTKKQTTKQTCRGTKRQPTAYCGTGVRAKGSMNFPVTRETQYDTSIPKVSMYVGRYICSGIHTYSKLQRGIWTYLCHPQKHTYLNIEGHI